MAISFYLVNAIDDAGPVGDCVSAEGTPVWAAWNVREEKRKELDCANKPFEGLGGVDLMCFEKKIGSDVMLTFHDTAEKCTSWRDTELNRKRTSKNRAR